MRGIQFNSAEPEKQNWVSTLYRSIAYLVCLLLSVNQHIAAQNVGGASVETIAQYKRDTATIKKLLKRCDFLVSRNPDSCLLLLNEAYAISWELGHVDYIATTLLGIGACYNNKTEYTKCFQSLAAAYPYCLKAKDPNLLGMFYHNMSNPYYYQGKPDTAIYYLYKTLDVLNRIKEPDSILLMLTYTNLGGYLGQAPWESDEAMTFFHKAEVIASALNDSDMLAHIYVGMGQFLSTKKDYEQSRYYTQKAIVLSQQYRKIRTLQVAYNNMAGTYLSEDNPSVAITYANKSLQSGFVHPRHSYLNPYSVLGSAYFQLKNYVQAEKYLLMALKVSREIGARDRTSQIYEHLAQLYRAQKNYDKAMEYQDAYSSLRDSVMNEQKLTATRRWEVRYNAIEKDKELALNHEVINRQQTLLKVKNFWIFTIIIGSLLLAALLISLYRSYRHKQKLQSTTIRAMQQEQEINHLKAIMKGEEQERSRLARELHDGIMSQLAAIRLNFSTLQEQNSFGNNKETDAILQQLVETMRELRTTTHNLMPEILLEEGLVEAIRIFCEKMEQASGLEIDLQIYGTIQPMSAHFELSLYRMVQELVHNAIKYAQASQLLVQLNYNEESIGLTVEDNGTGMPQGNQDKKGIGLKSIQNRAKLLNGHMEFLDNGLSGTTVYLEFDIKNENKTAEQWQ